jgi:putative ABC transport system ATP-binding protein
MNSNSLSDSVSSGKALIRLQNVVKTYITAAGPFTALKGINLEVFPGEFLAITGKSGAGKTTLVNMISGTDRLTSGEVWVGDVCVHSMNSNRLAQWRGRNMGIVYQSFHLLPNLTLLENVLLPMDFCGQYRPRLSREKAIDLLKEVELGEHVRKLPGEISGGQQQRVAIARALANDPAIIVADEPTGRLDSLTAEVIYQIFESLVKQGKTIVMVTHDRSVIWRVSRALEIQDGEVIANASA